MSGWLIQSAALLLLTAIAGGDQTRTTAAGTARVSGVVIAAAGNRPIAFARVVATGGDPKTVCQTTSGSDGRFSCAGLAAGDYLLSVSRAGYLETVFGQVVPGSGRSGTPIRLAAGQHAADLQVLLARGAAINGTVTDDTGEAAYGTLVRAFRWVMTSGERTLQSAASGSVDDRGVYRIPLLPPGDYIVGVTSSSGLELSLAGAVSYERMIVTVNELGRDASVGFTRTPSEGLAGQPPATMFAPVFYPSVNRMASAATLTLAPGDDRHGVDFQLERVKASRVSGVATGPDGAPIRAQIALVDRAQLPGLGVRTARSAVDGRFQFGDLAPGTYSLIARGTAKGAPMLEASGREAAETLAQAATDARAAAVAAAMAGVAPLWAEAEVTIDGGEPPPVSLSLQAGMTLSGRVAMDGGGPLPAGISRMSVGLAPVGIPIVPGEAGLSTPAPLNAAGAFTIRGVMPGRYRVVAIGGVPAGLTLKSSVFGGRDSLDVPLEIGSGGDLTGGVLTLSSQTTEISGNVQDASMRPTTGVTVVVFAADEQYWTPGSRRIQAVRPASDGRYRVRGLPAGDYRIAIVADVEAGRWFDPEWLRTNASGAVAIRLDDGQKLTQDLRRRVPGA